MPRLFVLLAPIYAPAILLAASSFSAVAIDDKNNTQKAQWELEIYQDPITDEFEFGAVSLKRDTPHVKPWWGASLFRVTLERREYFTMQCFRSQPNAVHLVAYQSHCHAGGAKQPLNILLRFDSNRPLLLKAFYSSWNGWFDGWCEFVIPFIFGELEDKTEQAELDAGRNNADRYLDVIDGIKTSRQRIVVRGAPSNKEFTMVLPIASSESIAEKLTMVESACALNSPKPPQLPTTLPGQVGPASEPSYQKGP